MATAYTDTVSQRKGVYTAAVVPPWRRLRQIPPMRYQLSLADHRRRRGLSQAALAEKLGVEQPTVQRWESGKRAPDVNQIIALAGVLGVTPGELFRSPEILPIGPTLFIKGKVQAGVWREAFELPEDEWKTFHGRPDVTVDQKFRFGLLVQGDSMNEVYPHGTIVECIALMGGAELLSGKRVVVVRRNLRQEYEATVKEYLVDEGGEEWLVPRSTNPAFQTPIKLREGEPGVEETRVVAIVVGSYRPE